jgi:tetratricopeptide (TPR) repeat protein
MNKLLSSLLLALSLTLLSPSASAQQAREGWQDLLQRANASYNEERYDQAIELYTQAIQSNPSAQEAYRNLARAFFWNAQYPPALYFYDLYLVTFPEARDAEQIRKERRLTSARTSEPWKLPSAQEAALFALEADLTTARAYTRGGGGAWKTYQTLLATGYAHPKLAKLQETLASKLIDEHDALCAHTAEAPIPALDIDGWLLQRERLDAARSVATVEQRALIERRALIAKSAELMLLNQHDEAAKTTANAADQNPDLPWLDLMHISALLHLNQPQQALVVLERITPPLTRSHPELLPYTTSLRALSLQRLGQHAEATQHLLQLLSP